MTRSFRTSPRQRVLACAVGVGMAASATLAATGSAVAASDVEQRSPNTTSHYVVLLAAPPAATYDGRVRGLKATKPSEGETFDADAAEVQKYEKHLTTQQTKVAATADVDIDQSFTTAVNGFTAELTPKQALELSTNEGVLAVAPDTPRTLTTVSSPTFLGLPGRNGTWQQAGGTGQLGKGVVVGVLDTGITPEHPSFAGEPVTRTKPGAVGQPYRDADGNIAVLKSNGGTFTGECEGGQSFAASLCNSKLVSARYFSAAFEERWPPKEWGRFETLSPRDGDGHGTHTAGTAVGNRNVRMVLDGTDFGRGSGMAPDAKLATYKVCWWDRNSYSSSTCYPSDIVAAVNQAIEDGVDVINFSISGTPTSIVDPVELALLSATSAGIFVAAGAGNEGPGASTVGHNSPWTMTVAASTHHDDNPGTVVLGDGSTFLGTNSTGEGLPTQTPVVVSEKSGVEGADAEGVKLCDPGTLDPAVVTGKIVVCDRGFARIEESVEVARAGGVGMILVNAFEREGNLDADPHVVPTVYLSTSDGAAIRAYASATASATAALLRGNSSGLPDLPVPVIADFSSRGPALANGGDLLKPDIAAPGTDVIAAVAPAPHRGRRFAIFSGTSMASPHIAGLGALILGVHPQWSPSAVKSAMMTTAYDLKTDEGTTNTDLFSSGAGHVDPKRYLDPGLVYEATADDYLAFLAGTGGYPDIPGLEPIDPSDLNYPSIAVGSAVGPQTVSRTLTAVTPGLYRSSVDMPGFDVKVTPSVLSFSAPGDTRDVEITIIRTTATPEKYGFGHLTWSGGNTTVRSPIAVRPVAVAAATEEVTGEGTSGSASFEITPGVTGSLDLAVHGLAAGERHAGTGVPGPVESESDASNGVFEFTVPEGTAVARFDLTANDPDSDLDLYVMNPDRTGYVPDQGAGATARASERITLEYPKPGTYTVIANTSDTMDGGETAWTLDSYAVLEPDVGNLTVTPRPLPITVGQDSTVTATWSGLDAGTPYLGYVTYEGSSARTFVTIR